VKSAVDPLVIDLGSNSARRTFPVPASLSGIFAKNKTGTNENELLVRTFSVGLETSSSSPSAKIHDRRSLGDDNAGGAAEACEKRDLYRFDVTPLENPWRRPVHQDLLVRQRPLIDFSRWIAREF
jgi:hypothetical protein